ncbi:MAG: polysaccharide biosynthesis/export family protein [Alphaproteobacteria bacterium]
MKNILLSLALLIALTACNAVVALPMGADENAPETLPAGLAFTLQPGDTVKLTVYGEESLTNTYQIDGNGKIALPLLGELEAANMSKEALQEKIATALVAEGYLRSPRVTVDMESMRPVYVMGEVRNPGSYQWQPLFTAFQAVASAGGYAPRAARDMILIDRQVDGKIRRLNATENTPVMPGDSVTVRERIL